MTYDEIYTNILEGVYTLQPDENPMHKLSVGHITDPSKSVNWNVEQVETHNSLVVAHRKERDEKADGLHKKFMQDLADYVGCGLRQGTNEKQRELIVDQAYERGHSAGYHEVLSEASDLVYLFNQFLDAKDK